MPLSVQSHADERPHPVRHASSLIPTELGDRGGDYEPDDGELIDEQLRVGRLGYLRPSGVGRFVEGDVHLLESLMTLGLCVLAVDPSVGVGEVDGVGEGR